MSDEITTALISGGLYVEPATRLVYRFEGDPSSGSDRVGGWARVAGWLACARPAGLVCLVEGATLVQTCDEPGGTGAVVIEHDTGKVWVRMPDGLWRDAVGNALAWGDLAYPTVRSPGVEL